MMEKNVLSALSHPHVVKLAFSFQDATRLYIGLELCHGELLKVIRYVVACVCALGVRIVSACVCASVCVHQCV